MSSTSLYTGSYGTRGRELAEQRLVTEPTFNLLSSEMRPRSDGSLTAVQYSDGNKTLTERVQDALGWSETMLAQMETPASGCQVGDGRLDRNELIVYYGSSLYDTSSQAAIQGSEVINAMFSFLDLDSDNAVEADEVATLLLYNDTNKDGTVDTFTSERYPNFYQFSNRTSWEDTSGNVNPVYSERRNPLSSYRTAMGLESLYGTLNSKYRINPTTNYIVDDDEDEDEEDDADTTSNDLIEQIMPMLMTMLQQSGGAGMDNNMMMLMMLLMQDDLF